MAPSLNKRFSTFTRGNKDDLEMGLGRETGEDRQQRARAMELAFGLSSDQTTRYPGIEAYSRYMEESFKHFLKPEYSILWTTIRDGQPPPTNTHPSACWAWVVAVLVALKSKPENATITNVLKHIQDNRIKAEPANVEQEPDRRDEPNMSYLIIAVFAVLCWTTLTMKPKLDFSGSPKPSLSCHLQDGDWEPNRQHVLPSKQASRPISTLFLLFKTAHWRQPTISPIQETTDADALYESSLNFHSLQRYGKVTLRWVETLSEHLSFNPAKRQLSLFKFPSVCALRASIESGDHAGTISTRYLCCIGLSILHAVSGCHDPTPRARSKPAVLLTDTLLQHGNCPVVRSFERRRKAALLRFTGTRDIALVPPSFRPEQKLARDCP